MKRPVLLMLITGYVFFNTTCSKQRLIGKVICEGYIYDTIGGNGVEGIQVSLNACNPVMAEIFAPYLRWDRLLQMPQGIIKSAKNQQDQEGIIFQDGALNTRN